MATNAFDVTTSGYQEAVRIREYALNVKDLIGILREKKRLSRE
jgi:hypothetical protein